MSHKSDSEVDVHELCRGFQSAYESGESPSLADYLSQCSPDRQSQAFTWLLAIEIRILKERGEDVDLDEYLRKYPEFSAEIDRIFASQKPRLTGDETKTFIGSADSASETEYGETYVPDENELRDGASKPEKALERSDDKDAEPFPLQKFAQYQVISRLGQGGMGDVLLAEDTLLGRRVALKLMRPELSARTEFKERFFREARAMAALDHPNIVPIYQIGEEEGIPFLSMPFIQGENLAQRLSRTPTLTGDQVLNLMAQVARGLEAIHNAGLVHRDIKPSNIVIAAGNGERGSDELGQVRILDFGLVRFDDKLTRLDDKSDDLTGTQDILGTLNYLSPEQARRCRVDARSDLYSLGIVAYEAATGSHPFVRTAGLMTIQAIISVIPRAPRFLQPGLSMNVSDLIMDLLSKDPIQRPQSAEKLLRRIETIQSNVHPQPISPLISVVHDPETRTQPRDLVSDPPRKARFGIKPIAFEAMIAIAMVVLMVAMAVWQFMPEGNWWGGMGSGQTPARRSLVNSSADDASDEMLIDSEQESIAVDNGTERDSSDEKTVEQVSDSRSKAQEDSEQTTASPPTSETHSISGISVEAVDESYSVEDNPNDLITPTPAPIEDAQLAASGQLLVLKLRGQSSLTVYDVPSGQLVKTLLLPTTEFLYAAGGNSVLVYLRDFQELASWSLIKFAPERSRDARSMGIPIALSMNPDNGKSALVRVMTSSGTSSSKITQTHVLDLQTLDLVKRQGEPLVIPGADNFGYELQLRTNRDFSLMTQWSTRGSTYGITLRDEDGSYRKISNHGSQLFLIPSNQGYIFTGSGIVYTAEMLQSIRGYTHDLPALNSIALTPLIPAVDTEFMLGVTPDGRIDVYQNGRTVKLCEAGHFPGWANRSDHAARNGWNERMRTESQNKTSFTFDRRLWAMVDTQTLLLIPDANDRIVKRKFNLQELLARDHEKFLVVTSSIPPDVGGGEPWECKLTAVSDSFPLKFTLVEGPPGMTIDKSGRLSWQAADGINGRVPVSVRLENPSKQQTLFRFILRLHAKKTEGQELREAIQEISRAVDAGVDFLRSQAEKQLQQ